MSGRPLRESGEEVLEGILADAEERFVGVQPLRGVLGRAPRAVGVGGRGGWLRVVILGAAW